MHALGSGVDPSGFFGLESGEARLDGLEDFLLRVELFEWCAIYISQKKGLVSKGNTEDESKDGEIRTDSRIRDPRSRPGRRLLSPPVVERVRYLHLCHLYVLPGKWCQ